MMRPVSTVKLAVPLTLAIVCAWQASRADRAQNDAVRAASSHQRIADELGALEELQRGTEQVSWGARPESDVLGLARAAVTESGIGGSAIQSVRPTGDRPVPGQRSGQAQLREQTVRIDLQNVRLQDLSGFLNAWSELAPRWTVSSIELSSRQPIQAPTGIYAVAIVVTAPYAQEASP